jgi:hypothetical protein
MTAAPEPAGHTPNRPTWLCVVCEQDWPCLSARIKLEDDYRREPISVGTYLCARMHEAIADLGGAPISGMTPSRYYLRFLSWVRPTGWG